MVSAFRQIPRAGLIIDMRGNAGGQITAGERLLQLFTPRRIVPTRFQFRVNSRTRRMVSAWSYFERWKQSFDEALITGEPFSQGFPIEGTDDDVNRIGQRYFGPVVVITDALALSTADMFAAGFIDHDIGKIICIDKNMAAAGGNNWSYDTLRFFLPEFRLEAVFMSDLDGGILSQELRAACNENGLSLSADATVKAAFLQDGVWNITDGELRHEIQYEKAASDKLHVYPHHPRSGLGALPRKIDFGFTVRRCVRSGKNEGRLLEDLGIKPHIEYQPTLRDVLEANQDLIIRATLELSHRQAYDMRVRTSSKDGEAVVSCRTSNITALEVFQEGRHYRSFDAASSPIEFAAPAGAITLVIKGYDNDLLVANRVVDLNG